MMNSPKAFYDLSFEVPFEPVAVAAIQALVVVVEALHGAIFCHTDHQGPSLQMAKAARVLMMTPSRSLLTFP